MSDQPLDRLSVERVESWFKGIPAIEEAIARHEAWLATLNPDQRAAVERTQQDAADLAIYGNRFETAEGERIAPLDLDPHAEYDAWEARQYTEEDTC
jgi:hypothetical protein